MRSAIKYRYSRSFEEKETQECGHRGHRVTQSHTFYLHIATNTAPLISTHESRELKHWATAGEKKSNYTT